MENIIMLRESSVFEHLQALQPILHEFTLKELCTGIEKYNYIVFILFQNYE